MQTRNRAEFMYTGTQTGSEESAPESDIIASLDHADDRCTAVSGCVDERVNMLPARDASIPKQTHIRVRSAKTCSLCGSSEEMPTPVVDQLAPLYSFLTRSLFKEEGLSDRQMLKLMMSRAGKK